MGLCLHIMIDCGPKDELLAAAHAIEHSQATADAMFVGIFAGCRREHELKDKMRKNPEEKRRGGTLR